MKVILKGVSHYRWNADGKEMRVTCESFEKEFELAPPQEKERKKLTVSQMETLDRRRQAKELFEYWNSKGITRHKEFGQYVQFLQRKIKVTDSSSLRQMIDNYASVFDPTGQNMWWTAKWSIKRVLSEDRFLPENFSIDEYRVKGKENGSNREDENRKAYKNSGLDYWKE